MKKILVIINKNWETEPVLNALTNPKLRPAALPFPEVINSILDNRKNTLTTKAFCIAYMPDIEHPVGQFGFDSHIYH